MAYLDPKDRERRLLTRAIWILEAIPNDQRTPTWLENMRAMLEGRDLPQVAVMREFYKDTIDEDRTDEDIVNSLRRLFLQEAAMLVLVNWIRGASLDGRQVLDHNNVEYLNLGTLSHDVFETLAACQFPGELHGSVSVCVAMVHSAEIKDGSNFQFR